MSNSWEKAEINPFKVLLGNLVKYFLSFKKDPSVGTFASTNPVSYPL
jgi:hypothetical protein